MFSVVALSVVPMARLRLRRGSAPLLLGVVALLALSLLGAGHPSGLDGGRATCGEEFDSKDRAFLVPDIKEGWFVRRVTTCASPYFWVTFNGDVKDQELYIAAITPQIARFTDRLAFRAVLFGPGLPAVDPPPGVTAPMATGLELKSPDAFDSCAFVDENAIMRRFSDPIDGRCTEEFSLPADYTDPLRANKTWYSHWLYSKNHKLAGEGKYYLVSWLVDRKTGQVAQGKYEMTLGPWIWGKFDNASAMNAARAQITTCTCATNAVAYAEQHVDRIGSPPADFWAAELPYGICAAGGVAAASNCVASKPAMLSDGLEWSGSWTLKAGSYIWTFRAFGESYEYPDRNMTIVAVPCADGLSAVEVKAKAAIQATEGASTVGHGESIEWKDSAQTLLFNPDEANEKGKKVPLTNFSLTVATPGKYCIFTQHVPSEFLATHLVCEAQECDERMIFPDSTRRYVAAEGYTDRNTVNAAGRAVVAAWRNALVAALAALAMIVGAGA